MVEVKYTPTAADLERLDRDFVYHAPKPDQLPRYEEIRAMGKIFAALIIQYCPDSREKSLALTKLEEACFWANASIARNE